MINENGKATIIAAFCKAVRPPENRRLAAMAACKIPQINFILNDGFIDPNVVCIPSTNVAESAEVIKNTATSKRAIIDKIKPSGIWSNTPNKSCSVGKSTSPSSFVKYVSIAVVPNVANQKILTSVGAKITPIKNSRIVRPFEIRAIKIPTNGDHDIHHAQ